MNNPTMNILVLLVCMLQALACNVEKNHFTEVITEVFEVVLEDDKFVQGPLKFSESFIYDTQGREYQHLVYNLDKTVKGIESPTYEDSDNSLPSGSKYEDGNKTLLSYYKHFYNDRDLLIKKIGFDAANDEMLRIEMYHYDKSGNQIAKEIRTPDDKIQSIYNYTFDLYGNEKSLRITNSENMQIYFEQFDNIGIDKEKNWNQRWAYDQQGNPVSFSVRRKRVLKKSN